MNPLTNMKNVLKLSDRDLQRGGKSSWHDMYGDSAWIFVGGLPFDLSEGDVIAVFSQYGEIVNINLIRDKASGKSRGYGFICYEDQRSTNLTVDNLNGIKILNRTLRVDHVYDYKPPKDNDKTDEETRRLYMEGCAPKPQIAEENIKRENDKPSTSGLRGIKKESTLKPKKEDLKKVKKEKKEKKAKKEKKSKKKKKKKVQSSSSEDISSTDDSSSESEQEAETKKQRRKSKSPLKRNDDNRSVEKDRYDHRRRSKSPSKRQDRNRNEDRPRSRSPYRRHQKSQSRDRDRNEHRRRSESPARRQEERRYGDKNKIEEKRDKRRSRSRSTDRGFKPRRRSGSR